MTRTGSGRPFGTRSLLIGCTVLLAITSFVPYLTWTNLDSLYTSEGLSRSLGLGVDRLYLRDQVVGISEDGAAGGDNAASAVVRTDAASILGDNIDDVIDDNIGGNFEDAGGEDDDGEVSHKELGGSDGENDEGSASSATIEKSAEIPRTASTEHPVAGLSCADHGGPTADISEEMVYWKDIPSDSEHVSPFRSYGPRKKYFTFEPDVGGWNNIRMAMETAVVLALAMGRTIVMPPEQEIYLLHARDKHSKNTFSLADFFHFESVALEHSGVEIITMKEFLEAEIVTGNIRHPRTGNRLTPPQNRTDWDGMNPEGKGKELQQFLQNLTINPLWDTTKCFAVFPAEVGPGKSDALAKSLEEILSTIPHQDRTGPAVVDNPTPVDSSAKDRMVEMLIDRKQICVYDDAMQNQPVVHFGSEARLLDHFYSVAFFEDYKQDLWTKRFVRDHLRYTDEIQCAAARVVHAMREKAIENGNSRGEFDTFHIRRGDFQYTRETRIEAAEIYENSKQFLVENSTVYIATDERNMTFFDPLREHYKLYFLGDFKEELGIINNNFLGMVDQRIASRGRVFVGTFYSSFTGYINRMRGYHSQIDSPEAIKTGSQKSYYYAPKEMAYVIDKYRAMYTPIWAREFPVGWRDLDKGIEEMVMARKREAQ